MKGIFFYITVLYIILRKRAIQGMKRIENSTYFITLMYVKSVSACRRRKNKNKAYYNNTLNYNIYPPENLKISNINFDNHVIEIENLTLSNYNIVSVDYGYTFMGLCIRCKNKYIYEKITERHKNLIYTKDFDLPIKENVILFYTLYFKGYINNFFSFFHYLFEFIYNSNLIVIIGCNGPHMNRLSSDMGRHMCYFMNEVNGKRENPMENGRRKRIPFEVQNELITFNNNNIYKREQNNYVENYFIMSNKVNSNTEEKTDNTLNFSLKNLVTKIKDENNTLFSKFYNRNCRRRKDTLSATYLLDYFLKYYNIIGSSFLLPSRNLNYVYHMKK
ncbi:hypothetical protein, conserved [Plasmodium gonderi]|uniref:Uncharacterized protein n=1 Tax=Plasmodium gonderi TaxID=77519 RepID=A0A1Y1JH40_PLAGO|nr:hypothetical protein, conserved [Plasmodium gonderi]GAW81836.1 hypothetical protein, conserved [Plasmodium gonderi]